MTQKETDSLLDCEDSHPSWTCIPATTSWLHASDVQRGFVLSIESRTAPEPMLVLIARVIVASTPAVGCRRPTRIIGAGSGRF